MIAIILAAVLAASAAPAFAAIPPAYTNHTVGGTAGWAFNSSTNSSNTNYTDWAAGQSFNLGDYLVFNTNSNMTIVQTYNATTYALCSTDQDDSNETSVYADDGNEGFGIAESVAVALTVEGPNYYFSDSGDDGIQCSKGMRFEINVEHGLGLPPSLSQPPPPPPPLWPATPPSTESTGGTAGQTGGNASGCGAPAGIVWSGVFGVAVGLVLA